MKKMLKGFSLAELLIAMAIIAIIATLGVSISKQGIENAYNAYWYTGYKGLYDSITETALGGESLLRIENPRDPFGRILLPVRRINPAFIDSMASLLDIRRNNIQWENGNVTLIAPNGIRYMITIPLGIFVQSNDLAKQYSNVFIITMTIPQAKGRNVLRQTQFVYVPEYENGLLIPYTQNANSLDLQNRKDLLPFYPDDGRVGRVIRSLNGTSTFRKRSFYSFREVYCKRYQSNAELLGRATIINCNAYNNPQGIQIPAVNMANGLGTSIIKFENPRKVF